MKGAAISTTVCYILLFAIIAYSARKYLDIDWKFISLRWILLGSAVMGAIVLFINPSNAIGKIAAIAVGIVTYGLIILVTGVVGKGELQVIVGMLKGRGR
jgi:O-antigen/teichoic acid export membrane protein